MKGHTYIHLHAEEKAEFTYKEIISPFQRRVLKESCTANMSSIKQGTFREKGNFCQKGLFRKGLLSLAPCIYLYIYLPLLSSLSANARLFMLVE